MKNLKKISSLAFIAALAVVTILIYGNIHLCYRAKERTEEPEKRGKVLKRASLLFPLNDLVFYELGKSYFDLAVQDLSDKAAAEDYLQKSIHNLKQSLKINPASYFCHFQLAQSLLYLSYLTPAFEDKSDEEYKRAALLAGHNSQISFEVGKIFLSRWPELKETEREFTSAILKRILERKDNQMTQSILYVWEMNVRDPRVMERILPEDVSVYRSYAKFLGEKSLFCEERQRLLAKAELMEFKNASEECHSGEREFQYYRLKEASNHFINCLRMLERIKFYQNLTGQNFIGIEEFQKLKKFAYLNLAKCRIEEGREFKEVVGDLRAYLALEEELTAAGELESYLRWRGLIKEGLEAGFEDLGRLSLQTLLYFKQNRYRDIIRLGRLLQQSFIVLPEGRKAEYVQILQLVGDSFQKIDFIYDAGEFYHKVLEIEPENLGTLVRIRQNYERLNEEDKIREIDKKIEEALTPEEIETKNISLEKGQSLSKTLILDGGFIRLDLHFEKHEKGGLLPLFSIFFNGKVLHEDYLQERPESGSEREEEGEVILSLSVKSEVGNNSFVLTPLNTKAKLLKISYRRIGE